VRIVILAPSVYSETACAMAAHLAQSGHALVGAIALRSLDYNTLRRKLGQWGAREFISYGRTKLLPRENQDARASVVNPYLTSFLTHESGAFRSLREVGAYYDFPALVCRNQNDSRSIALMREWSPDVIVFTGGNILRKPVLDVPRLGVLNVHLGFLPEVRGMSAPEWSLLTNVPLGVTIHYMDAGIDTGPVLEKFELPDDCYCTSLVDLRNRLIALGVERTVEVVRALDGGLISAKPQSQLDQDNQFFVMHELLRERAAAHLAQNRPLGHLGGSA
jgi:folate-dependent phosphoribosylglycinamide formyltransferase PurN